MLKSVNIDGQLKYQRVKENRKTESKNVTYHRLEKPLELSRYPIRLKKIKLMLNGHLTITVPKGK
jgi:hypothetical protein